MPRNYSGFESNNSRLWLLAGAVILTAPFWFGRNNNCCNNASQPSYYNQPNYYPQPNYYNQPNYYYGPNITEYPNRVPYPAPYPY